MSERALTPKMVGALQAMVAMDTKRGDVIAWSPNEIGQEMGQPKGRSTRSGSSPTHARLPSEGSGISSVLRGLQARGLIRWTSRRDGYSGIAYEITDKGRSAVSDNG